VVALICGGAILVIIRLILLLDRCFILLVVLRNLVYLLYRTLFRHCWRFIRSIAPNRQAAANVAGVSLLSFDVGPCAISSFDSPSPGPLDSAHHHLIEKLALC
jgi:hypothetical protein